jgi:prophage DNA circulation protein
MSVLSDISAFSNPFGTPSAGEWNLSKGEYINSTGDSLVFFVESRKGENKQAMTGLEQIADSGGRRLAIYEYPYKDGQKIDDLGRKGESHTFNMKFHGTDYQRILRNFEQIILNDNGVGNLTHPVLSATRGALAVRLSSYELVHRYDEWNAVTIKATFVEDNSGAINAADLDFPPIDSALMQALQILVTAQAFIEEKLFEVGALINLPGAIVNSMKQRLDSLTGSFSRLIGQVSATFSPSSNTTKISSQAKVQNKNVNVLNSGTTTDGTILPPVFQSGFNPQTQAAVDAQKANFINANQVTPQQAVFVANQVRQSISDAIKDIEVTMGNLGYDMTISYRDMAIAVQQMVEVAISASRASVKIYIVPSTMSLRTIAKNNGLTPDRQNDIESLNPYLPSVNFVAAGSRVLVPAA